MEIHDLATYLPPPSRKIKSYKAANWKVCDQSLTVSETCVAIKDVLPSSMQDDLDGHQEDYCLLTHEDWCDLLYTIEVKDNNKRASTQIKKIASARGAYLSYRDISVSIPRKNKAIFGDGVMSSNKGPHNKAPKHHGIQHL